MSGNPLLHLGTDLPFDRIDASHVKPAIDALLADAREAVREIGGSRFAPTYENLLGALEERLEPLSRAMGVVGHLESVATTPELRAVYTEVQPEVSAFYASIPLDEALWKRLVALAASEDARALDPIRRRHLDKTLEDFRRHGAELDAAGKARLEAIDRELAEVTTKFSQNVLDATNAFELSIEDEARLAGLPESARAQALQAAELKGKSGYRFTLHAPSVIPVLTYLDDASIRETVWRAYNTRAAAENGPLLPRILGLRAEKAKLLGRRDFSDLVLADRMAKNGEAAYRFVRDLETRTREAFERETRELVAYKKEESGSDALAPWDVGYWSEKLRMARFDFDEEALRPYFAADRVLDGLFEVAKRLYDLRIARTEGMPTWDPSVRTFEARTARGERVGLFYVDLHPRENKRGGAWMNGLVTGGPRGDGGFDPHVALFCANATPPVGDRPALLTHDEVETLFHEFGHLLHQLLSRVPVRSLAGTSVAWDFVELPSQIMENWTWEREALDLFARHLDTNEPIPEELFTRMQRARTFRAATMQMRQLGFGVVDLLLHRELDLAKSPDVLAYVRDAMAPFSVTQLPADYAMIASFTHLFAHGVGYAAGYYSYKWAEVLDADAFSRFQREGLFSAQVGAEFRDRVLSRGDSADAAALFHDFMGRGPELDALLARNGLSSPSNAA
ncbi:MAG: M3 family metallopeptidase [Sandaracinus sp.]